MASLIYTSAIDDMVRGAFRLGSDALKALRG
jgi:hypothetical protein